MLSIPIIVKEMSGYERYNEPVQVGVSFALGSVQSLDNLSLYSQHGDLIPCQLSLDSNWHDGSCQWAQLTFQVIIKPDSTIKYVLQKSKSKEKVSFSGIKVDSIDSTSISVNNSRMCTVIDRASPGILKEVTLDGNTVLSNNNCALVLKGEDGKNYSLNITSIIERMGSSALTTKIDFEGNFTSSLPLPINVIGTLTFFSNKSWIKWDITIHNPMSASHTNGCWDLGDPQSFIFRELSFQVNVREKVNVLAKTNPKKQWGLFEKDVIIEQNSSGGENWNSENHVDSNNKLSVNFKGYKLISEGNVVEQGNRSCPLLKLETQTYSLGLYAPKFWQNFPKLMSFCNDTLKLSLFPFSTIAHELQPGERKTHSFFTFFEENELNSLFSPLECYVEKSWLNESLVLPFLTKGEESSRADKLILIGLDSNTGFLAKREKIDEYGWRNFGELYADHEALYNNKSNIISHYNNQYDVIYGFARQFMITGDKRWFELMDDLALHVTDIDIYRTDLDRTEYNGGLFWHTDHYLDAYTCTHRTFSNKQNSIYDVHGGGPGVQHCYTTGLMFHYYLTGNLSSKEAVLGLTKWITNQFDGIGGFLETLIAFKNRYTLGYKNPFRNGHKYPFDRGTGNYIVALLDSYLLTNKVSYLENVEQVIKATVHPNDSIIERNLSNIEETWFYTIFFQAILKYLLIKEGENKFDEAYFYALESFLLYAEWIKDNERPTLDSKEKLEFPNLTWAAQDVRKVTLLNAAYDYTGRDKAYLNKADEIENIITSTIEKHPTRHFTRILAILMQNHGMNSFYKDRNIVEKSVQISLREHTYNEIRVDNRFSEVFNLLKKLSYCLLRFSFKREVKWLRSRM